jgi:hypothetical protein
MIVALVIAMVKKHLVTIVNEINVVNNTGWWSSEKTSYLYIYIYIYIYIY